MMGLTELPLVGVDAEATGIFGRGRFLGYDRQARIVHFGGHPQGIH